MSKEDREVIEMANSSKERREEKEAQRRVWRQMRLRRFLVTMIPALFCILVALNILVGILEGWIRSGWASGMILVLGVASGLCLAEAFR